MKIYIAILFCAFMLLAGCQNDSKTEQINFLVDQIGEKNILEKENHGYREQWFKIHGER